MKRIVVIEISEEAGLTDNEYSLLVEELRVTTELCDIDWDADVDCYDYIPEQENN